MLVPFGSLGGALFVCAKHMAMRHIGIRTYVSLRSLLQETRPPARPGGARIVTFFSVYGEAPRLARTCLLPALTASTCSFVVLFSCSTLYELGTILIVRYRRAIYASRQPGPEKPAHT